MGEVTDRLREDFDLLREAVAQRTEDVRQSFTTFVDEHPLAAVGVAFGAGYLLSGALYSRTTGRLLGFGARMLLGAAVRSAIAMGGLGALASIVEGGQPVGDPAMEH